MYYLQSRYYDAKICRFINADSALYHSMLGYNMFAYCNNNPVNYYDPFGEYCEALVDDDGNPLNDWLFDGGMSGGFNAANYVGPGSAYYNYSVYSKTSFYNASLGGYYTSPLSTGITHTSYYFVSGAVSVIDSMATKFLSGGVCFVAGTLVKTSEGDVPIESIQVGDYVYAHNPETGETELKPVVNTFVNEATELVHIFADGEEIICTNEHPFYSPVKGWVEACKLRAGDILVSLNGEYIVVEQVQHEILEAPIKVYNFEVEDFHTYFVGDGEGVLVHNQCDYTPPNGGGGITNSISINGKTVTFGHGGRHLSSTNLAISDVEKAIAKDVITKSPTTGVVKHSFVNVNGVDIFYSYFTRDTNLINVGSYRPVK